MASSSLVQLSLINPSLFSDNNISFQYNRVCKNKTNDVDTTELQICKYVKIILPVECVYDVFKITDQINYKYEVMRLFTCRMNEVDMYL